MAQIDPFKAARLLVIVLGASSRMDEVYPWQVRAKMGTNRSLQSIEHEQVLGRNLGPLTARKTFSDDMMKSDVENYGDRSFKINGLRPPPPTLLF